MSKRTGLNGFMDKLLHQERPEYCVNCAEDLEWYDATSRYCPNKDCYRFGLITLVVSYNKLDPKSKEGQGGNE